MDREGGGNDGREILKSEFNLFAILCVFMCVRGGGGGEIFCLIVSSHYLYRYLSLT